MENISMDSLLKSLRENYKSGDFESVKKELLNNKQAFKKGEFHYDLGTIYSKMGNYAVGRYHLEKAVHEGFDSVAVRHNLKSVESKLAVEDISKSNLISDMVISKGLSYGTDMYIFLSLILLLMTAIFFYKKLFTKWVLILFLLISLSPLAIKKLWLDKFKMGVLFTETEVYEGPSGIFEKVGKIPEGAKVIIGKSTAGWFFIEKPLSYAGWIKTESLGVLK